MPLSETDITRLVADTLLCSTELAKPLSQLVYRKTQGNPFFTTQFLKGLYEDSCITFDPPQLGKEGIQGGWQCDMAQVQQFALTNDVVEFMVGRLQKLPEVTQKILKLAACIGNQFDLATLAVICEFNQDEVATNLWEALQEGFVIPENETYKFFQGNPSQATDTTPFSVNYRFLHDRVQQAAYSLISEEKKQDTHLKIGQLLLENIPADEQKEKVFEIVNQLNQGIDLITQETEQKQLAQLNSIAAYKAKLSTAYRAAAQYFKTGIELLPKNPWQQDYELAISLYLDAAETAFLNGEYEQMEQLAEIVLQHTKSPLEQARIYDIQIQAQVAQGEMQTAISILRDSLQSFGLKLPHKVSKISLILPLLMTQFKLERCSVESLYDLPELKDQKIQAAFRLIRSAGITLFTTDQNLFAYIILVLINRIIKFGLTDSAAAIIIGYAIMLYGIGNFNLGYQVAQLSQKIAERSNSSQIQIVVYNTMGTSVFHWIKHLKTGIPLIEKSYKKALESGELEYAGSSLDGLSYISFYLGKELTDLEQQIAQRIQVLTQIKQLQILKYAQILRQALHQLLVPTQFPAQFSGPYYNEATDLKPQIIENDLSGMTRVYSYKMILAYLFGQIQVGIQSSNLAQKYLIPVDFSSFVIYFYDSLLHISQYAVASSVEQRQILKTVKQNQAKLKKWAKNAPENCLHKFRLVEAERYRILKKHTQAIEYYERAISGAKENEYIQEEALANELAAKFYLEWGKEKIAQTYMVEAYYCYSRWGAKAKVIQLEKQYPQLLASILQQPKEQLDTLQTIAKTSTKTYQVTSSTRTHLLDLISVTKASQALSGEIELEKLVTTLMQVILENAGATKGVLIFNRDENLTVEAVATQSSESNPSLIINQQSLSLENSLDVPLKLINRVKRQSQPLIFNQVTAESEWTNDAYILTKQPQSLLCLPILNQGKLLAILYLENTLMTQAFTPERVEILKLLCSQAAISLENAELYRKSQNYAQQLEQSIEQLQASDARFQKLADNIPGMIYQLRIDTDGLASAPYISSGCQRLYEVGAEEIMTGKYNLRDFEHPEDQAAVFQAMVHSAQTLTPFEQEWRIVTPNGNVKWVKAASQPDRLDTGEIIWDGILLDITDRKRIEAEQQRLLAILENTVDFIGTADPTGQTLYLNQAWRNLLGLEDDTPSNTTDIPSAHPAWAFEIVANQGIPEAARSGMWVGETAVLDHGGREIPVSQIILAHKSSNGEVEYFSTILRDISKIKAAEAALQISERNLRTIFDNSNNAILIHDTEGTLLDVNNRMLEMYRLDSREQALSLAALDYSAPDNPFEQVPLLWSRAVAGEMIRFEWKARRPHDDSIFDIEIVLNKITLDDQDLIIANIQDISDRKRAEAAVIQKSQELEKSLTQLQEAQVQLVQSEKMSALGQMMSGITHEINNPLGFVSGNINQVEEALQEVLEHLELYQQNHPPGEAVVAHAEEIELEYLLEDLPEMVSSMKTGVNRIKEISKSMRIFSRSDQEQTVEFDLHENLDSTLLILKHRLKANEKRPEIQILKDYGNLPQVHGFPGQLNQVFMNILANAIDMFDEMSEEQSIDEIKQNPYRITLKTELDSVNKTVNIQIQDNGCGMSEDVKAKVFEHLFTTKAVGKGTGLGLSIARQIVVDKHGGKLQCDSTVGQGTEFVIQLPI